MTSPASNTPSVPNRNAEQRRARHMFALRRRHEFLSTKDGIGPRNSYDRAEVAALSWAIRVLEREEIVDYLRSNA